MDIGNYLDADLLAKYIEDGWVSARPHKQLPLVIYNYTPLAAHSLAPNDWTETLRKCRGLIAATNGQVISLGMHKFFNMEDGADPGRNFTVAEKLDGSLGIVYDWNGWTYIATRGSFHSEQADWANAFLNKHPEYVEALYHANVPGVLTPHVEIVYKENQIVVDYDYEDLVFLGVQGNVTWTAAHNIDFDYPGRVARATTFADVKALVSSDQSNNEGYVIQMENGTMVKYKHDKYLELHRAVSNLNPKYIWEQMVAGTLPEFIIALPNEFQEDAENMRHDLICKYKDMEEIAWAMYNNALARAGDNFGIERVNRGDFAREVMGSADTKAVSHFLFSMYDDNMSKLHDQLLKAIKP